jgi:hypothetical protein
MSRTFELKPAEKWLFIKLDSALDDTARRKGKGRRNKQDADTSSKHTLMTKTRRKAWVWLLPPQFQQPSLPLYELNAFRLRFRHNDSIAAAVAVASLLFALFAVRPRQNEVYWTNGYKHDVGVHFMRSISMILSFVNLFFIYRHYAFRLLLMKAYKQVDLASNRQSAKLIDSARLRNKLIVEILVNLVMPIPGENYVFQFEQLGATVDYALDSMIVAVMMVRLYHLLRLFEYLSFWTSPTCVHYCNYNSCDAGVWFALKSHLQTNPYLFVSVFLGAFIGIFGVWLRIFERDFPSSRFDEIWNGGWIIIETMTTIGYGEIVPRTHLGRFTAICACVLGNFLLSLIVVALSNTISFTSDEDSAFGVVKRKHYMERNHKLDSIILLQRFARLNHARTKKLPGRLALLAAFCIQLHSYAMLTK